MTNNVEDFTEESYKKVLQAIRSKYELSVFIEPPRHNSVYLRHDCDISLNRALAMARIERAEEISSTFFLLLHSSFYSLLERAQCRIVKEIISLGHEIGLHFDAGFYQVDDESQLDALIFEEASWLEKWFGQRPTAVSFHNPDAFTLRCERERYGGLVNCYSAHFKRNVGYCSDSNGYWRHERILDVVRRRPTGPLQVLVHPEWWQDEEMYARERVMRCVRGRAISTITQYDEAIAQDGRQNLAGPVGALRSISSLDVEFVTQLDYLWNARYLDLVFLGLWRMLNKLDPDAQSGGALYAQIADQLTTGATYEAAVVEQACEGLCKRIAGAELERYS